VPTLGVWPGVGTSGTKAAATNRMTAIVPLPGPNTVDVTVGSDGVTVTDVRPAAATGGVTKQRNATAGQTRPNTPSVGGPSWLRKTTTPAMPTPMAAEQEQPSVPAAVNATRSRSGTTKVYLKPVARAKAGAGGVALSNPISTALVRRGDTVSIEYTPDAVADVGEGGVAISRPELIIQFID